MASNETPMDTSVAAPPEPNVEAMQETTSAESQPKQDEPEEEQQQQQDQQQDQHQDQQQEQQQTEAQLEQARVESEKAETERLEKIKLFVEQQSDLYKQIFSQTKELLNINVCKKLEECISQSKSQR